MLPQGFSDRVDEQVTTTVHAPFHDVRSVCQAAIRLVARPLVPLGRAVELEGRCDGGNILVRAECCAAHSARGVLVLAFCLGPVCPEHSVGWFLIA